MPEIQNPTPRLTQQLRDQTLTYMITAFGLVAGLAWNDAVQSLINFLLPGRGNSVAAKFTYGIFISIVVIVLSRYLSRIFRRP